MSATTCRGPRARQASLLAVGLVLALLLVAVRPAVADVQIGLLDIGAGPTDFPQGITLGPDGNIWVAAYHDRIARVTPTGSTTWFDRPGAPTGGLEAITTGPDGNLWFVEMALGRIGRITTTGQITEFDAGGTGSQRLGNIAAGPDGNVWFTKSAITTGAISRITPGGQVTEVATGLSAAPMAITTGPDGNLWFTQAANRVGRLSTSGQLTEFDVPGAPAVLRGIVAGPDGNLWAADSRGAIDRITTAGILTSFPTGGPTANFPLFLASGSDGNLWYTVANANRIGRMTPRGVATEFATGLTDPTGESAYITPGPGHTLYFTNDLQPPIGVVTGVGADPTTTTTTSTTTTVTSTPSAASPQPASPAVVANPTFTG